MASLEDVNEVKYGFSRPEMYTLPVGNSLNHPYERHLILRYKSPPDWPSIFEKSVDLQLPYLLNASLKAREADIPLTIRLTLCGGCNGTECADGDVLIFPDMIKYKGLQESDVDAFVDDVLVKGKTWGSRIPVPLVGTYVFVCAHASRDKRCGVCGPVLIEKFETEIKSRGLGDQVSVNVSSHLGGHKYAGNIVIYRTDSNGKVHGDWYGYVTPDDVPDLIDLHIGKGEIIKKIWRGQMGLNVEKGAEKKLSSENGVQKTEQKIQGQGSEVKENFTGCCQGANAVSCCRDVSGINDEVVESTPNTPSQKCSVLPQWISKLERNDVWVAAGVVGAVAAVAVAVAYSIVKRSS